MKHISYIVVVVVVVFACKLRIGEDASVAQSTNNEVRVAIGALKFISVYPSKEDCEAKLPLDEFMLNGDTAGDAARCKKLNVGSYAYSMRVENGDCLSIPGRTPQSLCLRLGGIVN